MSGNWPCGDEGSGIVSDPGDENVEEVVRAMGSGIVGFHIKGMGELSARNELTLGEAVPPKSAKHNVSKYQKIKAMGNTLSFLHYNSSYYYMQNNK